MFKEMLKKKPKYDPVTMGIMSLDGKPHPENYQTDIESFFSGLGNIIKLLIYIPFLPVIIPIIIIKAMIGD